ncbi:MAG TPA: hypothetical protein VEW28_10290 [Candidatus Kapabacteria bacterium]|nr:hypothetical protein [Candidatus Kapabacteria bacterium]
MKIIFFIASTVVIFSTAVISPASAQGPRGSSFGFGIVLVEPLGGTVKFWTASDQAFVGSIGGSYFGNPRLNVDYIWHFDAFNSQIVKLYAGPGLSLGFGQGSYYWYYRRGDYFYVRDPGSTGIGIRVMLGLNIIPRRTPMELFIEAGPLIGVSPAFGSAFDFGLGVRFYP